MGLQKCPLWHGQLVPQTKAESSHWAHSGNSRAFSEPFCAHPMEARGPLLHFQSVFVQLLNNSPAQSLAWLHILLLFDLNEEIIPFCSPTLPLHWKSCTVQYLPELLSISALFSQHSYKHVLISTRDVSVCKYLVNTLKKTSCIILVQIPLVSLLWQKKAYIKFSETNQVFFLFISQLHLLFTLTFVTFLLPNSEQSSIYGKMYFYEMDPTTKLLTRSKLCREVCSGTLGKI